MKCIRNPITGELRRVTEYEAKAKFLPYGWVYASKGEWKKSVRPNLSAMKAKAAEVVAKLKPAPAGSASQGSGSSTRRV